MVGVGGSNLDQRFCAIRERGISIPFARKWLKSSGETVWKIAEGVSRAHLWRQEATESGFLRPILATFGTPIWDPFRIIKQFRKMNSPKSICTIVHRSPTWRRENGF